MSLIKGFTFTNTGPSPCKITAADIVPNNVGFSLASLIFPVNVTSGASVTLNVTAQSAVEGPVSATLRVFHDASLTVSPLTVGLTANFTATPVPPTSVTLVGNGNFGDVQVN
jgi:hypothetical protein